MLLLVSLTEERAIYLALELDRSWTETVGVNPLDGSLSEWRRPFVSFPLCNDVGNGIGNNRGYTDTSVSCEIALRGGFPDKRQL